MAKCEYFKPGSLSEAIALMARYNGDAAYIAGGTDVMVLMRQKKLSPKALISLRNVEELCYKDTTSIGGGVTHAEIEKDPIFRKDFAALCDAVRNLGSTQIRNVATIAGNICNAAPSADTACPLLVLDARVILAGPKGERDLPIDDFFVGPGKTAADKGEILKAFKLPVFDPHTGSAYIKHTRRSAMDLPIIGIAVRMTLDRGNTASMDAFEAGSSISRLLAMLGSEGVRCEDVRIAMGVVAPRPIRAKKAEDLLRGKVITDMLVAEAAALARSESSPRDSVRGEAWYRKEMVGVLVKRAVMRSIERVLRPDQTAYLERSW
jgi:carbon-monoxide dehydrogenase medium subunit